MPQTVELSDKTFRRLQSLARPLIDDTNSVIDRLIESFEKMHNSTPTVLADAKSGIRKFDCADAPPLTHTKLLSASVDGVELDRPNWNELMRKLIEIAFRKLGNFEEVRRATGANIVKGQKFDEGYSPLSALDGSIQGVDSNGAWRISYAVAKRLSVPVEVMFEWRDKDAAAFPGKYGILSWPPMAGSAT